MMMRSEQIAQSIDCCARCRPVRRAKVIACLALAIVAIGFKTTPVLAQSPDIEIRGPIDDVPRLKDVTPSFNTTVVPQREPAPENIEPGSVRVDLEARLTENSKAPISTGVVWRVFAPGPNPSARPRLIRTLSGARPGFRLLPGTYFVNAAYGRANLTRRITILARGRLREVFVLNAGGLRPSVVISGGGKPVPQSVNIDIYSDESDQSGARRKIVSGAKPGQVIRLNAGIYHIESRIGRSNAYVRAEVSVEAGKITDARVEHDAAFVTFRLVRTPGGEAIPGATWAILAENGDVVRESVGALPRHILAPGRYLVSAGIEGRSWRQSFAVISGVNADVEIVAQ
ncbi:MAG: hypothetical protein AAFQ44_05680 [Pseudomonadota bacterium]